MRKINFWVTHKVKNKEEYFNKYSSSSTKYDYDEKKYMFLSKFSDPYEIDEVNMKYLNFKANKNLSSINERS